MLSITYRLSLWHMHGAVSAETCAQSLLDLHEQWPKDDVGCHGEIKVDCFSGLQDGPADCVGSNSIFITVLIVRLLISVL